jgi:O-antigen ligase
MPMKKILPYISHTSITYLACCGVILGLFLGKAIISISVTLFMVNAAINKDIYLNWKDFYTKKVYFLFGVLFIIITISGLWSNNLSYFSHKIGMHLPYLTIAFGIQCMRISEKKYFHYLFLLFIICTSIACVHSLYLYLQNKSAIDASYSQSKLIPTAFHNDHIRFSVAVVLSIIFSIYILMISKIKWHRIVLLLTCIFLIIYLHILAVKTGILAFYIIALLAIIDAAVRKKQIMSAIVCLLILLTMPLLAYHCSNTFKAKYNYFMYTLNRMNTNQSYEMNFSDEGRIMSYKTALDIWKQNMLFGVGAGDITDAMSFQYDKRYGLNKITKKILPHNQFLVMALMIGALGFIIFAFTLLLPLFLHYRKYLLLKAIWLLFFISIMVEPMHETQIGLTIHVFFILLLYKYIDNTESIYTYKTKI